MLSTGICCLPQFRHKIFLWTVSLDAVAVAAKQLEIFKVVRAAPRPRHHVINLEYLEREVHPASVAQTFLLTVQHVLVLPVVLGRIYVRAARYVRAVGDSPPAGVVYIRADSDFVREPVPDEFEGLFRQVRTYPLAPQLFGCHQRGGASAERIEDDVTLVAGRPDDALQQCEGFLRRVPHALWAIAEIGEARWLQYQALRRVAAVGGRVPLQPGPDTGSRVMN